MQSHAQIDARFPVTTATTTATATAQGQDGARPKVPSVVCTGAPRRHGTHHAVLKNTKPYRTVLYLEHR